MLNRYPRQPPSFATLRTDPLLRPLTNRQIALFFLVRQDTVQRWARTDAPRNVRLILWAMSCEGLGVTSTDRERLEVLLAQIQNR